MNRRSVLAALAAVSAPTAGCLDDPVDASADGNPTETPTPDGDCGTAAEPLSDRLVEQAGDTDVCFEGATPDLVVVNERSDAVDMTIEASADGDRTFDGSYELDPGERVVERSAVDAHGDRSVDVTVDGSATTGSWTGDSCYRHAVVVTPDGVSIGVVPPLSGPGDTQHDCYAGDSAPIRIYTADAAWTATLRVVDRCAGRTFEESYELDPDDVIGVDGLLVNGGVYDVRLDVESGDSGSYEFRDDCWGVTAGIDEDGTVTIRQLAID